MSDLNLNKEQGQPENQNLTAQSPIPPAASVAPQPAAQNTGALTTDDTNMAMLAHLLAIVTWFVGPLIIWMMNKDLPQKGFVTDQAKEALNFQITVMIAWFVAGILTVVLIGIFLMPVIAVGNLVLCILAGLKARDGIVYRYPFTLRLIK